MPYSEENTMILSRLKGSFSWYPVGELKEYVYLIESLNFRSFEDRELMRKYVKEMLYGMAKENQPFFDEKTRFPSSRAYAYLYAPIYIDALYDLLKVLDYRYMAMDNFTDCIHDAYCLADEEALTSYNTNMYIFYTSVSKLKKAISEGEHIYTRKSLERRFGLKWIKEHKEFDEEKINQSITRCVSR